METIRRFEVKSEIPFGGKKGRIVIYSKVGSGACFYWEDDNTVCPYSSLKELENKNIFKEIIPPPPAKWEPGSIVVLFKQIKTKVLSGSNRVKIGSYFNLPAFVPFTVVKERIGVSKSIYVTVLYNNCTYEVIDNHLHKPEVYYFVSSKGETCPAYEGREPQADTFRKATGNYFKTHALANNYRTRLLKK